MKLTLKNYHTPKNKYLSVSKIKDFQLDKRYFYDKHIAHTIETEKTDALIIGSAVDTLLLHGNTAFNKSFKVVERRNRQNPPDNYTELNPGQYKEVLTIVEKVRATTAYQELNDFNRQVILTEERPIGKYFKGLCGMLDLLKVSGTKAIIVDLKTSNTIDPLKYYYHCVDYAYFLQAAMYRHLVKLNNPKVKTVEFFHLTVEKDNNNIYHVQTFKFDDKIIDNYWKKLSSLIMDVSVEEKFLPMDTNFKDTILITTPQPKEEGRHLTIDDRVKATNNFVEV